MIGQYAKRERGVVRRLGLTAAVVAALVLSITSCGGSDSTPEATTSKSAKTDASASASPAGRRKAADKSLQQVEADLRFATSPYGDLRMPERREGFCIVHATVPTLDILDSTATKDVVRRMQTRGWTLDGPVESDDNNPAGTMSMARLESGKYEVLLGSVPMPPDMPPEVEEAYAPNKGLMVLSPSWSCKPG